jgi:ribosome-associated protein
LQAIELARLALDAALDKKALEPVLLDVREQSSYTDYILIISGRSDRHVQSVAEGITTSLKEHGARTIGVEGKRDGHWALLDYVDVVVHVFYHPVRERYDLEGLWSDAPRVPVEVPPESRLSASDSYSLS